MNIKLLHDKILVLPIEGPNKTKSGIYIPQSASKENLGKVIIISDKVQHIKPGDIIKYHNNVGIDLILGGVNHLILKEGTKNQNGDVIAILENKDK